jgi:hypothetical protein
MATSAELKRLERQFFEAEGALVAATTALNRARAENGLSSVSSPARADNAWMRMIGEASRMVQADSPEERRPRTTEDTVNLILDSSRFAKGEVVSVAEARRQRLNKEGK